MLLSENPSLITRMAVGKGIGLLFGLVGFISLPFLVPEVDPLIRWGVLLWYTTLGAIIAIFGVFTWHPVLRLPLPWWVRAPLIGGWMNFVLTLFTYDVMEKLLLSIFGTEGFFASPFWFVLEGAIVGIVIGGFATKLGGEGRKTIQEMA